MEEISTSAIDYFYQMVLIDFLLISKNYYDEATKDPKKVYKDKDNVKEKYDSMTIDELLQEIFFIIIAVSDKIRNDPQIYKSINNYLDEIKDYIDLKNKKIIETLKTEEKDIYRAYGFLWGIRFLLKDVDLKSISLFDYKEYQNFSDFLEKYGNSKNLSKNYNKNFSAELNQKKVDIKFVHDWIKKLNEGKLSPMSKSSKSSKKKKKNKQTQKEIDDGKKEIQTSQISNDIIDDQNNMENCAQKEEKGENSNNIEKESPKNTVENVPQEKILEKNEKETEESSEENKNKNIIQNTINSSSYSNNSENEIADENNSGKNNKNIDGNYPQKISLVPSVELIIKNEKQNINYLYKNIGPQMSPEMSQLINFFSNQLKDITTALEDKINLQNIKIVQHEKDITNLNQRIHKLEVNQLMLYHQISLYQSSEMYLLLLL